MQPVTTDLTIKQGVTFRKKWSLTLNGTPANFTGATAKMTIRLSREATDPIREMTTQNNEIILGGVGGTDNTIEAYLSDSVTTTLDTQDFSGVYDLFIDMGTDVLWFAQGTVTYLVSTNQ